jgi:hypothetical protein
MNVITKTKESSLHKRAKLTIESIINHSILYAYALYYNSNNEIIAFEYYNDLCQLCYYGNNLKTKKIIQFN